MRQKVRILLGVLLGLATLLGGQLAIENIGWWWTNDTTALDAALLNAMKFAVAGSAGLAVGIAVALRPLRRRRRML